MCGCWAVLAGLWKGKGGEGLIGYEGWVCVWLGQGKGN